MESKFYQSNEAIPQPVNDPAPPGKVMKRPANGFLAFCHRHRKTVSYHNPHVENRQVTKILGSWWSMLKPDLKKVYEDKANAYKALFMAANPEYKWYNQKVSTGNTPVTRQSNRRGKKLENDGGILGVGAITPGKLADESQMGGLSSLMLLSAEQSKKRHIDVVSYIANEHDYLESKPENNNTIILGENQEEGECDVCHNTSASGEMAATEENSTETNETSDYCSNRENSQSGDDVSENKENPRQSTNYTELDHIPSFTDFVDSCPIFSYDSYLEMKNEKNPASKRALAKRRKWQQAISSYTSPDAVESTRRRKRRRIGNYRPQRRSSRTPLPGHQEPESEETERPSTSGQSPPPYLASHQGMISDHCVNFNSLDLLVSAARTLELENGEHII